MANNFGPSSTTSVAWGYTIAKHAKSDLAPSSSGLGHEAFILETWVQIPVGSQRARSSMAEQVPFKHVVGGSNPPGLTASELDFSASFLVARNVRFF